MLIQCCFFSFIARFVSTELKSVEAGNGVTIKYSDGQHCLNSTTRTSSIIHVVCSTDELITDVSFSNNNCTLTAIIKSYAGCGKLVQRETCPGSSSVSSLSHHVTILTVVLLIIILVVWYRRRVSRTSRSASETSSKLTD